MTPQVAAVFFDVDFTLIYPGPTFQAQGYARFCAQYGIHIDESSFPEALRTAASILEDEQQHVYDAEIFERYTRRIIEVMGGVGDRVADCAREIYAEWAVCRHFFMYDDVAPTLAELSRRGLKIGLISNSHRSLEAFQEHFALGGLVAVALSSAEHGYLKPHPSIFEEALQRVGASAAESVMVGDSVPHDIAGAQRVGMRGVLLHRSDGPVSVAPGIPVIRTLTELPPLLHE